MEYLASAAFSESPADGHLSTLGLCSGIGAQAMAWTIRNSESKKAASSAYHDPTMGPFWAGNARTLRQPQRNTGLPDRAAFESRSRRQKSEDSAALSLPACCRPLGSRMAGRLPPRRPAALSRLPWRRRQMEQIGGAVGRRHHSCGNVCASEHTEREHAEGDNGAEGPAERSLGLNVQVGFGVFDGGLRRSHGHLCTPSCDT